MLKRSGKDMGAGHWGLGLSREMGSGVSSHLVSCSKGPGSLSFTEDQSFIVAWLEVVTAQSHQVELLLADSLHAGASQCGLESDRLVMTLFPEGGLFLILVPQAAP